MAIIRWSPSQQVFNAFFDSQTGARRWVPAVDLVEADEHYVLRADLPGVKESDVSVELEDNVLTVSGERRFEHEHTNGGYRRLERSYGRFSRTLTLPDGVDPASIEAHFADGVLEVQIPKPERRKPHKVEIKAAGKAEPVLEGSAAS